MKYDYTLLCSCGFEDKKHTQNDAIACAREHVDEAPMESHEVNIDRFFASSGEQDESFLPISIN